MSHLRYEQEYSEQPRDHVDEYYDNLKHQNKSGNNNYYNDEPEEPGWKKGLRKTRVLPAYKDESKDEQLSRIFGWIVVGLDIAASVIFLVKDPGVAYCCGVPILSDMLVLLEWSKVVDIVQYVYVGFAALQACTFWALAASALYAWVMPLMGWFLLYATFLDLGPTMSITVLSIMSLSLFFRFFAYRLQASLFDGSCLLWGIMGGLNLNTVIEVVMIAVLVFMFVGKGMCVEGDGRPTFFDPTRDALGDCPACPDADITAACQVCNDDDGPQCYYPFTWRE